MSFFKKIFSGKAAATAKKAQKKKAARPAAPKVVPRPPPPPDPVDQFNALFDEAKSAARLEWALTSAIGQLLRRQSDATYCADILAQAEAKFRSQADLAELLTFAKTTVEKVLVERRGLKRGEPQSSEPRTYPDFEALFAGALEWRLRQSLQFFQRRNAERRDLLQPFLLTAEFADRLLPIIGRDIAPVMVNSRQMAVLAGARDWTSVTDADFWNATEDRQESILALWNQAWEKLHPVKKKTDKGNKLVAGAPLKQIRAELASPNYVLPRIDSSVLSLFAALLDQERFGRPKLDEAWTALQRAYQQEMGGGPDAKDGALRDCLLDCGQTLDDHAAEFLAILCFWNFPKLTIKFLEGFSANMGVSADQRRARIPYLMGFLEQEVTPSPAK